LSEKTSSRQFSQSIVDTLEDKKALDLIVMDVQGHSPVADRFVLASGGSGRHLKALAHAVVETAHEHGLAAHVEGMAALEWLLIDLGDEIVHLFLPEVRQTFQLEKLWGAPLSVAAEPDKETSANMS